MRGRGIMEDEMRVDKRAHRALTLFVALIGSAAMAAPSGDFAFSSPLNADNFANGPWSAGVQLAMISGPAASGAALQPAERAPQLTLAKQQKTQKKGSAAAVCAAKCDKAYRYCYSQGNQIGKPYVTGGQPCDEQKLMCMRACPQ